MRFYLIICFLLIFPVDIFSQNPSVPPEKPKLIIGIVISEMRYDYINRYWDKFSEGGFKRLVNGGTYCKNTHHDYLISEPGEGFASIATGAYPDVHGIVSDYWYDRLRDKVSFCISDDNVNTVGGPYEAGKYSPKALMSSSLSDQARVAAQFKPRVISISLDPRAAVLSGGRSANAAYWFDSEKGNWITSSYYLDSLPSWVNDFNAKNFPELYLQRLWEPVNPLETYTESMPDDNKYESGFSGKKTFPYDLNKMSLIKKNQRNYDLLRYTPYGNSLTKDFAIASIVNEGLGTGASTDWLQLGFSASGYMGSKFSSASVEIEDTYLRLDKDLEHFLNFVDQQIGMKNVLIYLTSDNAMADDPAFLTDQGMPSGYFNYNSAMSLLGTYLNLIYGKGDWVKFYYAQQIYLNRDLIENSKLSLSEFQSVVAAFMIQFEGVSNTLTATNLMTNNYTRGFFEKIQKSYNQKRSGDVLLHLSPGWTEKGVEKQYASAFRYDTHVPLIWYGWKIGRSSIFRPVSVTDIMPTIAVFLDIPRSGSIEGNLIKELF
ncbi:MAG: alkaline phosphatase family protein [Bacteroidales bacterium]|nr:alkaline phosphatase family protein [Bacteroidales bacterium]MCB8999267.1 alkaline phosphatase family protein [Bacteroidales bacterium]MCB9013065.1 alkaline phosphatase family protein [Bacteroidales bacterium]